MEGDEPFTRLLTQGMVLKDGAKMSKSKGNTVDPEALIARYGADTARLFMMFAAPPEQSLEWQDAGVEGAFRFLKRLWRLVHEHLTAGEIPPLECSALNEEEKELRRRVHDTIAKVSDDMGRRNTFNTAIAAVMELGNAVSRFEATTPQGRAVIQEALESMVLLLSPIVPHITHVLWRVLGHERAVIDESWPTADQGALQSDSVTLVVQVNGKLRGRIQVAADADRATVEQTARQEDNVHRFIEGREVKKVIVVPGKLVNIVAT